MPAASHPASFRDPDGIVFHRHGQWHRQINHSYRDAYDHLMGSGLYAELTQQRWLIPHEETEEAPLCAPAYRVITPEQLSCISYPYEWCFSQLQDAALLTLRVLKTTLRFGMTLKDASAYNVQFHEGKPIFIDTVSFTRYREGQPWVAYRQFCEHFLAPLAVMSLRDVRLGKLLRHYLDGLPLDLASKLLPWHSRLSPALWMHIHLHAFFQQRYAGVAVQGGDSGGLRLSAMQDLLSDLAHAVRGLRWTPGRTTWANYYQQTNYQPAAFEAKAKLITTYLRQITPTSVWDLGGNTGVFSRLATAEGIHTVCFDLDDAAVEMNYRACRQQGERLLLPLLLDLTNPSGDVGWANEERQSLRRRGPAGMLFALALIHHLAIGQNVPLPRIAAFLAELGETLVIEFVPKSDSHAQRLFAAREDIFPHYTPEQFVDAFSRHFTLLRADPIPGSDRVLYLFRKIPVP